MRQAADQATCDERLRFEAECSRATVENIVRGRERPQAARTARPDVGRVIGWPPRSAWNSVALRPSTSVGGLLRPRTKSLVEEPLKALAPDRLARIDIP